MAEPNAPVAPDAPAEAVLAAYREIATIELVLRRLSARIAERIGQEVRGDARRLREEYRRNFESYRAELCRKARDLRIDKRKVMLDQPLRELGTFMVEIELADGTTAAVKTIISEEK